MPVTKSEIMYFGLGLALGAAAGTNWDKIKKAIGPLLDSAGKGFGHAYADVAEKFADVVEASQDATAERRQSKRANGKARSARKSTGKVRSTKKKTRAA